MVTHGPLFADSKTSSSIKAIKGGTIMKKGQWLLVGVMNLATLTGVLPHTSITAHAGDLTLRWNHIIGIQQPGDVIGSGNGQVIGNERIWTARKGVVKINLVSGNFYFKVKGLVLASGNGTSASDIGTPGTVTQVRGTLVCDLDGSAGGSVLADTGSTDLSKNGTVVRSGNMWVPPICTTESDNMFLIRIVDPASAADQWIAAGVEREE
jgi:hypothetical protein